MKNKTVKKLITYILILTIFFSVNNIYAFAKTSVSEYKEEHDQINLNNVTVSSNDNNLDIIINNDNLFSRMFGNIEKEKIMALIDKYPELETALYQKADNGETICAISYTEAPIAIYEDHTERVKEDQSKSIITLLLSPFLTVASAYQYVETQSPSYAGNKNFCLFTFVSKQDDGSVNTCTIGTWEKGSWIGGSNYPASGYDYVYTSVPSSFTRESHSFDCLYTSSSEDESVDSYSGTEGKEYVVEDGNSKYIQIKVKDDPLGLSRLQMFVLVTKNSMKAVNGSRTVNSYYVHTWTSMDVGVTISASSEKVVSLSLTPEITSRSWQVYNYVTFNF